MIIIRMAVGNAEEAFVEEKFTNGLNIISSDDNNKGKTIVMQSMMYALGNEPAFPTTFNFKEYYHFVEIKEGDDNYKICRKGNDFVVKHKNELLLFDNVSELKRYWTKNIYHLPVIIKNQTSKIVDPVLFLQLYFVGQDKKDTSNISHSGLYNKKDYLEMIYSIKGVGGLKLEAEETEHIKTEIVKLKNEKRLLLKQYKILSSSNPPVQYISSVNDRLEFKKKLEKMETINAKITEIRNDRTLAANRKSKWQNTIKELRSLNRNIDVGELKCMDCNSNHIAFSTSSSKKAYSFDVSTTEMRSEIINSISDKISAYDEEIEKYDQYIMNEQSKLQELMKDEQISLESIVAFKEEIFSASDAELEIEKLDLQIEDLQNKLVVSENTTEVNKRYRDELMEKILKEMNLLYKKIDPNGNLYFDSLFTKRDEIFSGSEATIFHIARLYALKKILGHTLPIIIDSFRAEDLSTGKEKIVIDEFKKLDEQVIFTTTLKDEEIGKYDQRKELNHIDYKEHIPSKMLSKEYVLRFKELVNEFAFEVD